MKVLALYINLNDIKIKEILKYHTLLVSKNVKCKNIVKGYQ